AFEEHWMAAQKIRLSAELQQRISPETELDPDLPDGGMVPGQPDHVAGRAGSALLPAPQENSGKASSAAGRDLIGEMDKPVTARLGAESQSHALRPIASAHP